MIGFDEIVFKISNQGNDTSKLGRWSWATLTGKNNAKSTIITCYCSCKGTSPESLYFQHLVYMADSKSILPNNMACPRQLFGHDLKLFIEKKMETGHQLIVCGDFNSEYSKLKERMIDWSLIELIENRHGPCPRI